MSCLYVTEQGSKVSVNGGRFIIDYINELRREIPEEIIESIMVFGNVEVTHGAQKRILEKGISMSFLSTRGRYFGRLHSTSNLSAERVKKQVYLSDDQSQRVLFAKATLRAKINNQIVLLRRYSRNRQEVNLNDEILHMSMCEKRLREYRK